jgi:hypothetical protein
MLFLDRPRAERQLHHVEHKPKGFDAVAVPLQVIDRPIVRVARRIKADVPNAKLRKLTVIFVILRGILRPEVQAGLLCDAHVEDARQPAISKPFATAVLSGCGSRRPDPMSPVASSRTQAITLSRAERE